MNILKRAIIWLLTKQEKKTMTDQVVDAAAQAQTVADTAADTNTAPVAENVAPTAPEVQTTAQAEPVAEEQPSALAVLKASFEKKLQFIEDGIATLGADAEKELVDLAEKYL